MKAEMRVVLQRVLKKTPLFSGLAYSTPKVRKEARKEFAYMWCASMMPIFFGVFIYLLTHKDCLHINKISTLIVDNFNAGEIFIFACAALAPAAFLMSKYNRDRKHFPNHIAFQWSLGIIFFSSTLIFGLFRAKAIVEEDLMRSSALILYFYSLVVWYLSIVYNDPTFISFVQTMRNEESELTDDLRGFKPPET